MEIILILGIVASFFGVIVGTAIHHTVKFLVKLATASFKSPKFEIMFAVKTAKELV